MGHSLNLRIKLEQKGQKGKKIPFFLVLLREREREEEEERALKILSVIYGAPLVGFRRAKDKSSSHRQRVHVGA